MDEQRRNPSKERGEQRGGDELRELSRQHLLDPGRARTAILGSEPLPCRRLHNASLAPWRFSELLSSLGLWFVGVGDSGGGGEPNLRPGL